MGDRRQFLPEIETPYRLGRHVNHDPRSLRFAVQPTGVAQTKIWERRIPVLDQGQLGSCTGNATIGVLGTSPYYEQLTPVQRQALNEDEAVRVYSLATQLDPWAGAYPPEDTGSDGLSAAKAAVKLGYLSGYQHITSISAAQTAIIGGPFIVGTVWLDGMFDTTIDGQVRPTGSEAGGHEYECYGYNAELDQWLFWNSWGSRWGVHGSFWMSGPDFASLLAQQGDATTFVPVTQPAPTPTPVADPLADFPWAAVEPWRQSPHWWSKATTAAKALTAWKTTHGL